MATFSWAARRALLGRANRNCFSPICSQRREKYIVLLPEIPEDTPETNSLLRYTSSPELSRLTVDKCYNAVGKLVIEFETGIRRLEEHLQDGRVAKNFSTVIEPLEKLSAPLDFAWNALRVLSLVNRNPEISEAYNRLHPRVCKANYQRFQSLSIYHAIKELLQDKDLLTEAQVRVIKKYNLEALLSGIDLTGSKLQHFKNVLTKLNEQKEAFRSKLKMSTDNFHHPLDPSMVKHFPRNIVKLFAEDKTNPGNGPWKVTLHPGIYEAFMEYCGDRLQRWNVWNAYNTRASVSNRDLNNSIPIEEIRSLRQTQANLLGYKTFAELSMETKMAGTVENVQSMIATLSVRSKSSVEQELSNLQKFAAERGFKDKFELWDVPYWRRKQRHVEYNYDEAEVRQYFPFPTVLDGLFQLFNKLFGITIAESTSKFDTWHSDVKLFDVFSASGSHAGSFYLDPYVRPSKHYGEYMVSGRNRSKALGTHPVAYLVLSLPPPLAGKPSLLSFNDVSCLIRKFGHVLQHCLTDVEYSDVSGLTNLEWDVVDVCPMFLDSWLHHYPTVASLSKHIDTEEPLPESIHSLLKGARTHLVGYDLSKQLYFSALDMELYSCKDFWFDVSKRLWAQYIPFFQMEKRDSHVCSFSAIFTEEYPAAYFSFTWSKMIAADVFSAFQEVGLDSDDKIKQVGSRFRDTFLTLGGGCHASEVFRRFRGRDPSPDSLLSFYSLQEGATDA